MYDPLSSTCQKYAPDQTRAHNGAPAVSTRRYGTKAGPGAELYTSVPFPWTRSGFQSQTSVGVSLGFKADRTACGRGKRAVRLLQVAGAGLGHVGSGQTRSVHQPALWERRRGNSVQRVADPKVTLSLGLAPNPNSRAPRGHTRQVLPTGVGLIGTKSS